MLLLSSADFFQLFQKILSETLSVCLSNGLDPEQDSTVCKGCQQMTKDTTCKERVQKN